MNNESTGGRIVFTSPGIAQVSASAVVERAAALILLLGAGPAIAAAGAVVSLLSRRSPFVAHRRVGRHGQEFWMLKLRSMWNRREPAGGPSAWVERIVSEPDEDREKNPADPRVTSRVAAFLRRHSIDELPQLWHIVRGEMSLVGPRPLTRTEVMRHFGDCAGELLSVKPGITGLWQIRGRSTVKFPARAALDLELVRSLTPKLYFEILLRTLPALLSGKGAW
ncbi:MAG: sugar transferase [Bryobacteraceae bacterium]